MLLRKDYAYKRMVDKCVKEMYSEDERKNAEFYIADAKGVPVWSNDKIEVDMESTGIEVMEQGPPVHLER